MELEFCCKIHGKSKLVWSAIAKDNICCLCVRDCYYNESIFLEMKKKYPEIFQGYFFKIYNLEKIDKKYEEFWKEMIENPDGSLNKEQIKKELCDFSTLIDSLSKLYLHITGGMVSKPMTKVEEVLTLYEEELSEKYDDGYNDAAADHEIEEKSGN